MLRGLLVAACVTLPLTACGGSGTPSTSPSRCESRALAELQADVASLRRAARLPTANRLQGNRAVSRATDRFLHDLAVSPIDNKQKNRMIDHAAGTLVGACEQCFQALEAARPIPSLRMGETGGGCGS